MASAPASSHCVVHGSLSAQTITSAAQLLSRAFLTDPFFNHVQPSEGMRQRGLPTLFKALLRNAAWHGGVLATAEGVVAWTPVCELHASVFERIRQGYATVPLHFGINATRRLMMHDGWCCHRTLALSPKDAAYIHGVGVEPALAGRGIGSTLMKEALTQIGREYRSCSLRTEQPKNLRFYEKLGFRCVEQVKVPATGLPSWFFLRES